MDGQTPLTLQGFSAGEHRIVVRRYNHFGSKTITLEPGAYGLQLKLETYNDIVESIEMSKGQTLKKEYSLEHTKRYLDSVAAVEAALKKKKQWARRIVFGVLAAGSGGLGAYFNM